MPIFTLPMERQERESPNQQTHQLRFPTSNIKESETATLTVRKLHQTQPSKQATTAMPHLLYYVGEGVARTGKYIAKKTKQPRLRMARYWGFDHVAQHMIDWERKYWYPGAELIDWYLPWNELRAARQERVRKWKEYNQPPPYSEIDPNPIPALPARRRRNLLGRRRN
ncbi:hypothetical protein BT63DRAFT_457518 [Microthyrium microscopicum]|uniref:Uncharacterized protein n=1 Tax=Microthyrium microscopicum TaxID=703497 RepID=A0A6A6U3T7_9PEZI|nr:hypothetical protein BT63DRAFT_457518 [Microthyrium microscopicum]